MERTDAGGNTRLHLTNALLLLALFGGSLLVFPDLPERIPAHFDGSGDVTRWETRSLAGWLLIPLIALGTVGITYGSAALLLRRPELVSLPEKEALLRLPPERREPVMVRVRGMLYGMSMLILVLFGLVQWMRWRTAMGAAPEPYVALTLVVGFLIGPLAMAWWLPRISREIRRQTEGVMDSASSSP